MPVKPMKPCRIPTCQTLSKHTYCDEHRYQKQQFQKRSSTAMGYGRKWRAARKSYLEQNPICACGCGRLAEVVDHIVPHKGDTTLFWDRKNWQPMTVSCHNRKTAKEDMGAWGNKLS